jgi:hypothetical protein
MQNVLELKPNFILGDSYEGQITLPAWIGFQSRQGFYGSKDSSGTSNGLVKVHINGRQVDYVKTTTQEQINALSFLHDNADKIRDGILNALFNELSVIKEIYEGLVPEINSISDFKNVLGLSIIHVMDSDKDGIAYLGYEFGCDWDDEHGLGVMMHKERVIGIGQAGTSFNSWITYKDNGTEKEEEEKWNTENASIVTQNKNVTDKPWWKFW